MPCARRLELCVELGDRSVGQNGLRVAHLIGQRKPVAAVSLARAAPEIDDEQEIFQLLVGKRVAGTQVEIQQHLLARAQIAAHQN